VEAAANPAGAWQKGVNKMKVIKQKEFEALEVINGVRQCPGDTDYSNIKDFGKSCSFGEDCRFGVRCTFDESCSFDELCDFGKGCNFGERCSFSKWCSFGERCGFGEGCKIASLTLLSKRLLRIAGISESARHELYCWPCESGF
jgi:hypothetical protein